MRLDHGPQRQLLQVPQLRQHERLLVMRKESRMTGRPVPDPMKQALRNALPKQPGFVRRWNPAAQMYEYKPKTPTQLLHAARPK
jgi:hypothetical protein